jgi:membrane protease YdiL (CAAX protease family)
MGGKIWWWALLFVALMAVWAMVPAIPGPSARDFGDFIGADRGEDFFSGAWGWFALVVVFVVFNTVLGEELLFRGLLLPRMRAVFGKRDWVANGVLFTVFTCTCRGSFRPRWWRAFSSRPIRRGASRARG